jgi:hypothetical protein
MPYQIAPCLFGWTCRFCIVRGWSRHDLGMIWEWYASVTYVFYMVFEDFRSKLEFQMHVSYSDFFVCFQYICSIMYQVAKIKFRCAYACMHMQIYVLLRIFLAFCAKLQSLPAGILVYTHFGCIPVSCVIYNENDKH